jgi:hypothetical protein
MTPRRFFPEQVKFELKCEPEAIPVRGNALASGDDEVDKQCEDKIIADLEAGNEWAWCTVIVEASWAGFTGWDSLGACSSDNEAAFRVEGGYFRDMVRSAIDHLLARIRDAGWEVAATDSDIERAVSLGLDM